MTDDEAKRVAHAILTFAEIARVSVWDVFADLGAAYLYSAERLAVANHLSKLQPVTNE